jgi:hypothetical protein
MALTTLASVKTYLGSAADDFAMDAAIEPLIDSQSEWFEGQVGYPLVRANHTEPQIHPGGDVIIPRAIPVVSVASVVIEGAPVDQASGTPPWGGWLLVDNAIHLRGMVIREGALVEVTYSAGYPADQIPADIEQAVNELVALKFRESARVGVQTVSMSGSSVSFLPSITPRSVQSVIDRYRRVGA